MKTYLVTISAYSIVVVKDAESEEQAMELAIDQVSTGCFDIEEAKVEAELLTDDEVKRHTKQANYVVEPE